MTYDSDHETSYDFIIIGSGFGGSVSAMRLAEKGYRVLVLERGRRYLDQDFPRSNWDLRNYLWLPVLRCFGLLQLSLLPDALVMHWSGVGGGSLGYANVLVEPDDSAFEVPAWRELGDWKEILAPHYAEAKRMLGRTSAVNLSEADRLLHAVADEMGRGTTFEPVQVGVFFGPEGEEVPDPYFGGEGPARSKFPLSIRRTRARVRLSAPTVWPSSRLPWRRPIRSPHPHRVRMSARGSVPPARSSEG